MYYSFDLLYTGSLFVDGTSSLSAFLLQAYVYLYICQEPFIFQIRKQIVKYLVVSYDSLQMCSFSHTSASVLSFQKPTRFCLQSFTFENRVLAHFQKHFWNGIVQPGDPRKSSNFNFYT